MSVRQIKDLIDQCRMWVYLSGEFIDWPDEIPAYMFHVKRKSDDVLTWTLVPVHAEPVRQVNVDGVAFEDLSIETRCRLAAGRGVVSGSYEVVHGGERLYFIVGPKY